MARNEEAINAYAAEILEPETLFSPARVIALRKRFHASTDSVHSPTGKSGRIAPSAEQEGPSREEIESSLQTIESEFYSQKPELVQQQLNALNAEKYPDLLRQLQRRKRVAELLPILREAAQDAGIDSELLDGTKTVLIANQREAAGLKRQVIRRMSQKATFRRGIKFRDSLKKYYPELYELESKWFEQWGKAKRIANDSRKPSQIGFGCIGAYFLGSLIWRLIRYLFGYE